MGGSVRKRKRSSAGSASDAGPYVLVRIGVGFDLGFEAISYRQANGTESKAIAKADCRPIINSTQWFGLQGAKPSARNEA